MRTLSALRATVSDTRSRPETLRDERSDNAMQTCYHWNPVDRTVAD